MVTPLAEATTSEAVSQHGAAIIPDRSGSRGGRWKPGKKNVMENSVYVLDTSIDFAWRQFIGSIAICFARVSQSSTYYLW